MAVSSLTPSQAPIDTLKISLTNDCNLECIYCRPTGRNRDFVNTDQILQPGDLQRVVRAATSLGIKRAVVAGGEPLLRKDCANLVKAVAGNRQIDDLRLITNGNYLKTYADHLYKAGLRRIEINLDSLNFAKYQKITGRDSLYRVLDGIRKVEECGYDYIRINVLVLRGINDDEIIDFAVITKNKPYHIYFCEYRPQGHEDPGQVSKLFFPAAKVKSIIDHFQPTFQLIDNSEADGMVTRYRFTDGVGTINFCCQQDVTKYANIPRLVVNSAAELYNEILPQKRVSLPKLGGREVSDEKLAGHMQRLLQSQASKKGSKASLLSKAAKKSKRATSAKRSARSNGSRRLRRARA